MRGVPPGVYRHWRGGHYLVLFTATDSNNDDPGEDVVVYMSLTPPKVGGMRVRRVGEFLEQVGTMPGGAIQRRFELVDPG